MKDDKSDRITVGLFNDSFFPMTDGVISVVDNYARNLIKYADVIVFAPKYHGKEIYDSHLPYKVVRCKSIKVPFLDYEIPLPFFDRKYKKELNNCKLDIVHIHSPFTIGKTGVKYAKKKNIPSIATMHSQFKQDIYKVVKNEFLSRKINGFLIRLFNKCDECYAVNKKLAYIFHEDYGYETIPKVLENATEFKPLEDIKKEIINKKHNIKNDEKVFLFVGRLNTLKNILFIVDALKILKEKQPNLKFKMLFVGTGNDKDKLVKKIEENKLSNEVMLCGKVTNREELACYFARADLFLFPSKYDSSSIVQIEAASQKTPTLFLKDTVTSSSVIDGVNGFLANDSCLDYANTIIDIITNDKLLKKVSLNAFNDLYVTWDDKIKEVYDIYIKMVNKTKGEVLCTKN